MSTILPTDTRYQDPFLQTGFSETIAQEVELFNAASGGSIRLVTRRKPGDFDYKAFFANAGGLVDRQDLTSTADVTDKTISQDTDITVKLNRRIGPVGWTRSAFLKPGLDEGAFRVAAGTQAAKDATADMLNSGIAGAYAALANDADSFVDESAVTSLTTDHLVSMLSRMGDRSRFVIGWVLHSKLFFDLVGYQVDPANNGDVVANGTVVGGMPASLGKPIYVTDSPSLVDPGAVSSAYRGLALTADGILVEDSESEYLAMDEVLGQEQIVRRLQGEFGYNLGVKGFAWDVTNGGKNPAPAALETGTNWDSTRQSVKDRAGVAIQVGTQSDV